MFFYSFSKSKLRDILFEMFTDNTRVRVTHFTEKVRDKFGDKNCLENCKKLLKV